MKLAARVEGVGLVAPGLAGWEQARFLLAGRLRYIPAPTVIPSPEALPAIERRRAGRCVRIALAAGLAAAADAGRAPRDCATIFTSSTGDGETLHAICEALASDDRLISPTRFHNSVHNAPAGYWGIATGSMLPSDCLAAYDASFAAGFIEALGRVAADPATPVLLIAYDAPYPEPLHSVRPVPDAFAVGLVLSGGRGARDALGPRLRGDDSSPSPLGEGRGEGRNIATIEVETTSQPPAVMNDAGLEAVRSGIPAARALPLLELLAAGKPGETSIEYLDGMSLAIRVGR